MKAIKIIAASVLAALSLTSFAQTSSADDQQRLEQSRAMSKALGSQLSATLMKAMQEQGPVHGIQVCNEQAPAIAAAVNAANQGDTKAVVSRTALRVRNTNNAPTAEQRAVLEYFQARMNQGETAPELMFSSSDGNQYYMKAIVMQPQCAACHGGSIKPEIAQAVQAKYPADQATGFAVGDLRGAFLVQWLDAKN